jgi:D-sedoheptulose 7-phosphate isomerase
MESSIKTHLSEHLRQAATNLLALANDASVLLVAEQVAKVCIHTLESGHKILFAGNGGSAADSQHLAGELVSRLVFDRPALPAIALTVDSSVLTAIGNDYGYEDVFARQISGLGNAGDVFFGISTSGKSPNILRALEVARFKGLATVGLTGRSGGNLPDLCDYVIQVPSDDTPHIQEGHIAVGHSICAIIERAIFKPGSLQHHAA